MHLVNVFTFFQLFIPTLFITLSAAETKWGELLVILEQVHNNRKISEEDALAMTFQQKAALIRSDPCICALYFDHRFRSLLNLILNKKNGAFSPHELTDYYNKIEFAHRGSAHNHGLYWFRNAPIYDRNDESSIKQCIAFIDSVITCRRNGDEELEQIVGLQIHRHTHTCKRKTKNGGFKCRFNLPLPVMRETAILEPLAADSPMYAQAKRNYDIIQQRMQQMGRKFEEDVPFSEYVNQLDMTEHQ
jgi:Helitron helicase-like domain at N-terminus